MICPASGAQNSKIALFADDAKCYLDVNMVKEALDHRPLNIEDKDNQSFKSALII